MWKPQRYGTVDFPIHKSHLNAITGDYGCPKRFDYEMKMTHGARDQAIVQLRASKARDETRGVISASLACGSAVHETIARALTNPEIREIALAAGPTADMHRADKISRARVRATFWEELDREIGPREIEWRDATDDDYIDMAHGALTHLHTYAADIVLVEAGFTLELDGLFCAGHTDLIYRPRRAPHTLALNDWKTSKTKPDPIELNHGWESGLYSAAMRFGTFLAREHVSFEPAADGGWTATCLGRSVTRSTHWQAERDALEAGLDELARGQTSPHTVTFGEFPSEIHHVHLRDYIPYVKAGKKQAKRAEDLAWYGLTEPAQVAYVKGQTRGPAWIPVSREEREVPRLKYRLKTVVGAVRMNRFLDLVGERCNRCPYQQLCLNDGYAPDAAELERLTAALAEAGISLND